MKHKTLVRQSPSTSIAFERFAKANQVKNLSPATLEYYDSFLQTFIDFLGDGEMLVSDIEPSTIEDYILFLKSSKEKSLCDISVNTYLRAVRAFLYYCMRQNWLPRFDIKLIKADESIKEPYTNEELRKLLARPDMKNCRFSEYRNWVIVNFLLSTGCRVSTLIELKIKDLDFSNGTVLFTHMKARKQQVVPMSKSLCAVLFEYLDYRDGQPDDYLFISECNTQLTRHGLATSIRRYNHSRGVEKTSLHLFRHTFAKLYIVAGGDAFRLQKLLGHSDLTMTRHYVALYADDLKDNYDKYNPLEQITAQEKHGNRIALKKKY